MSSANFDLTYGNIYHEMMKYEFSQFKGKTIYMNCESALNSEPFLFFVHSFDTYEPKKVIMTGTGKDGKGFRAEYRGECGSCHIPVWKEHVYISELKGDGSFDSPECLDILKEADVVIGKPPIQKMFRDYMNLIQDGNKEFLLAVNEKNLNVREIIEPFKNGAIRIGATGIKELLAPMDYEGDCRVDAKTGKKYKEMKHLWITNLIKDEKSKPLELTEPFDDKKYKKYDNYDIIDVPKVANIPKDYDGIMGVPITYLRIHHQGQFEILGTQRTVKDKRVYDLYRGNKESADADSKLFIDGKESYARVFIKAK